MGVICFFKQKTAYEMRMSDWRSDVCSSDLRPPGRVRQNQRFVADVVAGLDARGGDIVQRRQVKRGRSGGKARGGAPPGRGGGADRGRVHVWPPFMLRT